MVCGRLVGVCGRLLSLPALVIFFPIKLFSLHHTNQKRACKIRTKIYVYVYIYIYIKITQDTGTEPHELLQGC